MLEFELVFENKNDVEINAIGIGHDVTSYYSKALKIADVQELGDALIDQLADLFIEEPKRKKTINFDEEQADLISSRIIQKITNHFASHLKDENTSVDDSIDFIEKVFQIGQLAPKVVPSAIEEKYKINLS